MTLKKLDVPVPPMLERACGYPGNARLVAFYWQRAGDEVEYDDGRLSGTGQWMAFLAYRRWLPVELALDRYSIGSSDQPAKHWLLLDRQDRTLSVGLRGCVEQEIYNQWVGVPLPEINEDEAKRLMQEQAERMRDPSFIEHVERHIKERVALDEDLVLWINAQPISPEVTRQWNDLQMERYQRVLDIMA